MSSPVIRTMGYGPRAFVPIKDGGAKRRELNRWADATVAFHSIAHGRSDEQDQIRRRCTQLTAVGCVTDGVSGGALDRRGGGPMERLC